MQGTKTENVKTYKFKISELKKIKFFENDPSEINYDSKLSTNVKTKIDTMIGIDKNKKTISVILNILFYQENGQLIELFGIKTNTSYKIENFESIIYNENNNKVNIPNQFLSTLIAIAYSNSRGMLAVLVTNEEYKSFILPIINPAKLLPNHSK